MEVDQATTVIVIVSLSKPPWSVTTKVRVVVPTSSISGVQVKMLSTRVEDVGAPITE